MGIGIDSGYGDDLLNDAFIRAWKTVREERPTVRFLADIGISNVSGSNIGDGTGFGDQGLQAVIARIERKLGAGE